MIFLFADIVRGTENACYMYNVQRTDKTIKKDGKIIMLKINELI